MILANAVGPPKASIRLGTDEGGEAVMAQRLYRESVNNVNRISVPASWQVSVMSTIHDRLRQARIRAGFKSARSAATRHGWKPSTYASHENGQTPNPPREAIRDYARRFRVPLAWLETGEGVLTAEPAPLVGFIADGPELVPAEPGEVSGLTLPPGAPPDATPVVVRGTSMYPRYFSGERMYYVRDGRGPRELIGEECVVKIAGGPTVVKIIRRGSTPDVFNLEYWNAPPMEDQHLEWAAPVRWRSSGN
jgi:phage repressor protein C with HTH and peptisase S24 domain